MRTAGASGNRDRAFAIVRDTVRVCRVNWWRFPALVFLTSIWTVVSIFVVASTAAGLSSPLKSFLLDNGKPKTGNFVAFEIAIVLGVILVSVPFMVAAMAAVARLTNDSLAGRSPRVVGSFMLGLRRAPALFGTAVFGVLAAAITFILAPVITLLGLLGLILNPLAIRMKPRSQLLEDRWPSVRQLVLFAIPFGVSFRHLSRVALAVPAGTLSVRGVRPTWDRASVAARGRSVAVVVGLIAAFVLGVALSFPASLLGFAIADRQGGFIARGFLQMVTLSLPIVVLTILYRQHEEPPYEPLPVFLGSDEPGSMSRSRLLQRRVAFLVPITMLAAVWPALAGGAPASALVIKSYVVNSSADDASTLAADRLSCADPGVGGRCTLRAAFAETQAYASSGGTDDVEITFASDLTIALEPANGALTFTRLGGEGGEGGGPSPKLTIDGRGHDIALDGVNATQVMSLKSNSWKFALSGFEIRRGSATAASGSNIGGGLLIGGNNGTVIDGVTFVSNFATTGAGAISNSGPLILRNSTFDGNSIGPENVVDVNGDLNGGANLYNYFGTVVANNNTFGATSGNSILTVVGSPDSIFLSNSYITAAAIGSNVCRSGGGINSISGAVNVVTSGDTSCPGTITPLISAPTTYPLQRVAPGTVPVLPLKQPTPGGTANGAIGVGGSDPAYPCAATDAIGKPRTAVGCDAGAFEHDPTTVVSITSSQNPSLFGTDVTFSVSVDLPNALGTPEGTVQLVVDGTPAGAPATLSSASADIVPPTLAAGAHNVTATFSSSVPSGYANSTSPTALVQQVGTASATVAISSSGNPSLAGDPVTLTITATGSNPAVPPTGTVTLTDTSPTPDEVLGAGLSLDGAGKAQFTTSALLIGAHTLVATYGGDAGNVGGTSASFVQNVRTPSTITLSTNPTQAAFGQPIVVSVHVPTVVVGTPPTGQVDIWYDNLSRFASTVLDANGDGTLTVNGHTRPGMQAIYQGDQIYASSSSPIITVPVEAAATATAVAPSVSTAPFGAPVTLLATVSSASGSTADPVGTVTFKADGNVVGTGTLVGQNNATAKAAYVTTSGQLLMGVVAITATFEGSTNFTTSTSPSANVTVTEAATATVLTSSANPSAFAQSADITATVTATGVSQATPTGQVVFTDDGNVVATIVLSNGAATLGTATLALGSHPIVATYNPTTQFQTSMSTTLTQVVQQAATTTVASVSNDGAPVGQPVQLSVTVTPTAPGGGVPSGTVVVTDNGAPLVTLTLVDGAATASLNNLTGGAHAIVATYSGATNYAGSTGTTDHSVGVASTATALTFSPASPVFVGKAVTMTATVTNTNGSSSPTGSVVFSLNGTSLGTVAVTPGVAGASTAVFTTADLGSSFLYPQGQHHIRATFVANANYGESTVDERYTVDRGTTTMAISTNADFTTITASITVVDGAGQPSGTVAFSAFRANGAGVNLGFADVVNGQGVVTGLVLDGDVVRLHTTYAGDLNYLASPAADLNISIPKTTPVIGLTGPSASFHYGQSATLTATLTATGRFTPTGNVTFAAAGPNGSVPLGTASVSNTAPYTAALATRLIPAGTTEISASYGGTNDLNPVSVAITAPTILPAATTTQLASQPNPARLGASPTLTATVANTSTDPTPVGTVTFSADGSTLGSATVGTNGKATIDATLRTPGSVVFTAVFVPANNFAASTGSLTQVVQRLRVDVDLTTADFRVAPGGTSTFKVRVSPLGIDSPAATTSPTGSVLISDGAGHACTATLVPDGFVNLPNTASGSCTQTWTVGGTFTLGAAFAGDVMYEPGDSRQVGITVTRQTPTVVVTADPATAITGDPVRVSWNVVGPTKTDGTITLKMNDDTVCTSTAVVGSCSYTFARNHRGQARFLVIYGGNDEWSPNSGFVDQEAVVNCLPFTPPTAQPAGAGTVSFVTAPNCNNGTGYLAGTGVEFAVTATSPDYTHRSWLLGARGDRAFFTPVYPGPVTNTAYFDINCVSVVVGADDLGNVPGARVISSLEPNCGPVPHNWNFGANETREGLFLPGTELTLTPLGPPTAESAPRRAFAGWRGDAPRGADFNSPLTVTLSGARAFVYTATFDVVCRHGFSFPKPSAGSANVSGGRTCEDRAGPGYADRTLVTVSTKAAGDEFFTGWSGGVAETSRLSTSNGGSGTVLIERDGQVVRANYDLCVKFEVVATGVFKDGEPIGEVSVSNPGNCPNKGAGYYTRGTQVHINATTRFGTFDGWTGLPTGGSPIFGDNYVIITRSATQTARFYDASGCRPFETRVLPPDSATLTVEFPYGNTCPAGSYDLKVTAAGSPAVLTTVAKFGNPMVGFSINDSKARQDGTGVPETIRGIRGSRLEHTYYGKAQTTAWTCEAISPTITLTAPNGTKSTKPPTQDTDFISTFPQAVCPLGNTAFPVGTEVSVAADAPTVGYTFVGWKGAVVSNLAEPDGFVLDGSVSGVNLDAEFKVICHKLALLSGAIDVQPKPNCPGAAEADSSYIGGTEVVIKATGVDGKNHTGWTAENVELDGGYAFTDMTKDARIGANYEEKSNSQKLAETVQSVGEQVSIGAKKAVGVVAAVAAGVATAAFSPAAYAGVAVLVSMGVSYLLRLAGVEGSFLDGVDLYTDYVSDTLFTTTAFLTCGTTWAANAGSREVRDNDLGRAGATYAQLVGVRASNAELAAVHAAEAAAQARAMSTRYALSGVPTNVKASSLISNLDKVTNAGTKVSNKLAKVGFVAAVGVGIYQTATTEGAGWDSDAATAWTDDGGVYNQCLMDAKPSYL